MSSENVVVGGDYCPFCVKVINYFKQNKINFQYVDVTTPEGAEKRKELSAQYNWKTVPMVFVQGKFIGGCDDFFKALSNKTVNLPSI